LRDIFNTTSALYLLEVKMHNGFQVVHSAILNTDLSVFYKRIRIFLIFFSIVYIRLILLVFWGKYRLCLCDRPPRALWIFPSVILRAAAASAARHHGKHSLHLFLALPQCSSSVFAEKLEEKQVEEE
jgi:hypothetical protein